MFLIESGLIKRHIYTRCGKSSLLDLRTRNHLLGENCLFRKRRTETAVAKLPSTLRVIPRDDFLDLLGRYGLLPRLLECLSATVEEQQEIISQFVTADSEERLAMRLLLLGRKLGSADGGLLHLHQRITHEELGAMVGTTRSRVGFFLKRFEAAGMIRRTRRGLVLHTQRIYDYIESRSSC